MKTHSLLFRIRTAAAALIVLALSLAGFGLKAIFDSEIERRAAAELAQVIKVLAAQVRVDANGTPVLDVTPTDPRFDNAYSGLYWQVSAGSRHARSRSLWDVVLSIPRHDALGERQAADLVGPNASRLLGVVQDVEISAGAGPQRLQIVAAIDRADLAASQWSFFRLLLASLGALGLILIAAMSLFVRLALRPFDQLSRGLQLVHSGEARSLPGHFPDEVQPVVDDLNKLIAYQDAAIDRGRARAGDLAHGLKTPLAVLAATSRQAHDGGHRDLAAAIDEQVKQISRQVDRVLAQARAGSAVPLSRSATAIAPVAEKIIRTLRHLPDTRDLRWVSDISPGLTFPGTSDDLTEILANLLDNARKWTKSEIRLRAMRAAQELIIHVDDDGPGMSDEQASSIARGRRWDESQPGTGFGLAIARDLAEGYGGSLKLGRSDLGGLSAVVAIDLQQRPSK